MQSKGMHMVVFGLVIIGGLNWGLVGLFGTDFVASILGNGLSRIVYVLVGVATVVLLATHKKDCGICGFGGKHGGMMKHHDKPADPMGGGQQETPAGS